MVVVRAESVGSDVHAFDPQFPADERTVSVHETRLALTDGLDFRAVELESCGVAVEDQVIERRPLVFDMYIRLRQHTSKKSCKVTTFFSYMQEFCHFFFTKVKFLFFFMFEVSR